MPQISQFLKTVDMAPSQEEKKTIKQIDLNMKNQLNILTKGFNNLNEVLNRLIDKNDNKEEIIDLKLKIKELEDKKCDHIFNAEVPVISVDNVKTNEQVREKERTIVPKPPNFNFKNPEAETTAQEFSSPWLQSASRNLKKDKS